MDRNTPIVGPLCVNMLLGFVNSRAFSSVNLLIERTFLMIRSFEKNMPELPDAAVAVLPGLVCVCKTRLWCRIAKKFR